MVIVLEAHRQISKTGVSKSIVRVINIRGHKDQNSAETRCRGFLVLESRCRGFSTLESRSVAFCLLKKYLGITMSWVNCLRFSMSRLCGLRILMSWLFGLGISMSWYMCIHGLVSAFTKSIMPHN